MSRMISIPEAVWRSMKARLELLEAIILDGAPVPDPSMERAVEASLRGDWGPLMRINEQRKGGGSPSEGNRQSRMNDTTGTKGLAGCPQDRQG